MKHFNQHSFRKLCFSMIFFLALSSLSFQDSLFYKKSCVHSCHFEDSYVMKKSELMIIKAIKHHGYEIKRGLEDDYGDKREVHSWRIINIRTPYGYIDELGIKIDNTLENKTKISAISICLNEKLPQKKFDESIKLYRKYFKTHIIDKIRTFNE